MHRQQKDAGEMTYANRIGARLRELRKAKGWSVQDVQKQLKKRGIEISVPVLYAYERSTETGHSISVNLIPVFCKIYGLKLSQFLPKLVSSK